MLTTGECFCGAITYTISGRLSDPLACHCSRCRKAFNAACSNYARVDAAAFRWRTGEHLLTAYVGKHGFGLLFCSVCGSTLCGTHESAVHGVTLGCLNGDPKIDQVEHIFVGSKAAWDAIPSDAKQFFEGRLPSERRA